jgi:hypothetical protein
MLSVGDTVEYKGYRGRVSELIGHGVVKVRWEDGAEGEAAELQLTKVYQTNRFNFILFRNYDGSVTSKTIPRATYDKLFIQ